MQHTGIKIFLIVLGFLWVPTVSLSLPNCPSDQTKRYHNCFGTYTNADGNTYVGEFKDDAYNGQGSLTLANGDRYVGEFKDNKTNGTFEVTFANGDRYVGEHRDDNRNGYGTYTFADGGRYVGEYKDGKKNGYGTFTFADGGRYVGEYKDGKKNGYGTFTFADGNRHVGEYKDDVRNGQGFFVWKDGRADLCFYTDDEDSNCSGTNVYDVALNLTEKFRQMRESQRKKIQSNLKLNGFYTSVVDGKWGRGTFTALASHAALKLKTVNINTASSANNLLQNVLGTGSSSDNSCPTDPSDIWHNCVGTYTYDDGSKYVGEWKDDKQHGQGTYTWPGGDTYIGEHKDNKKHGQGTYSFASGDKYIGEFKDNKRHGQGTYSFASGDKYIGEYKDDKYNGQGTYTFGPNSEWSGDKYVGGYKDGKQNGQGTYFFADGTVETGLWESGEFQGASTSPEVVENVNPDETREVASGTGFYVSEDGHIITNHHVIDGCMDIKVQSQGELIPTIRLAEDKQNDLALLKVSQEPRYVFALSNDSPYPLQEIVVAGFPFGDRYSSTLKFTKGIVSSLAGLGDNYSEIQIDAALQQGNSGGPIIDEYGNVVAVAVAKLDAKYMFENFGIIPENTNFGVKASAARNLLEANRVNLKASSNEIISKRDLSSIAADGTVYLTCWMTNAQLEQMKSKKVMFQNLD
ncbi:trypsin-like peptidase domain-containing protein [Planktomarina temperata]|nr:trypsin-like peptidase domain-containing protein [Planktomarina temperata]